jgi:hypothetical protein
MSLFSDYMTNRGRPIGKWVHYFTAFERHLSSKVNQEVVVLEIGVAGGGSAQMWQRYFGPRATIVGVDIDENCKIHEVNGVYVRIGDQSNPNFLQSLLDEFGAPDIVIDDGSHRMDHVIKTFNYLYPHMPKNAVYIVEDMHTAYWESYQGGLNSRLNFINYAKSIVDQMHYRWKRDVITRSEIADNTFFVGFYDSIVVFEKGLLRRVEAPVIGEGYADPF